ncbi:DUF222 domain-containing protein [Glycomyces sp. TRM65418]|uniref:HNH endonuclease signature motif containing protein n=1 Tax=Glycomyces sp. TRM65418 TaxID=2867006 RepID=UPI001CE54691|nr:HNH endonuclease signature motif containing protein [Glycomyces sp. TRM65418]MCC3762893.1 DUF222 domain-containing protein [Glycomyces sp. TRM65418]QZD56918.1 DUF222 domain-containing protein [Glycomyces sp. TRM65418]
MATSTVEALDVQLASPLHSVSGSTSRAQMTRALLDDTAALVNGAYATALRIVIDAFEHRVHREADGFSAQRDWLVSTFDFTCSAAGEIAVIAKYANKFSVLAEAALTGYARIDQVAYAVRSLAKTAASALFARTPFRTPVASPFDCDTVCASPEELVVEYAAHAPYRVLKRHLAELHANLVEEAELLDALGEESLQRLEVQGLGEGGMWVVSGLLSATTGMLLDKYLKTAVPPPRKEEADAEGVLPPQATRNAEALHQLLAGYGSAPEAVTRHGHTVTLNLTVDIETLQGNDTGRTSLLESRPISLARARFLACEGVVVPSVFDYATGEAIELGRARRLPNTALRRKLELEQPEGCAWAGCGRPVAWTEAHHVRHWADGGKTVAENLILLCRFHHGRVHTAGWSVTKTAPGRASIVHHEGHEVSEDQGGACGAGCADWRTDADMDTLFEDDAKSCFPTGLYPTEWSEAMTPHLAAVTEQVKEARRYFAFGGSAAAYDARGLNTHDTGHANDDGDAGENRGGDGEDGGAAMRAYRVPDTNPPPIYGERSSAEDLIPFLPRPPGPWNPAGSEAATTNRRDGPRLLHRPAPVTDTSLFPCPPAVPPKAGQGPRSARRVVGARSDLDHHRPAGRRGTGSCRPPHCRHRLNRHRTATRKSTHSPGLRAPIWPADRTPTLIEDEAVKRLGSCARQVIGDVRVLNARSPTVRRASRGAPVERAHGKPCKPVEAV